MSNLTKEEYLRLIEQFADEQYGGDNDLVDNYAILEQSWIPAESSVKEKMMRALNANRGGSVDLTNVRKEKIREALPKCHNVKVGDFLIVIEDCDAEPDATGKPINMCMDLAVWEERHKTPSGAPCRINYKLNFHKDDRFDNRPWLRLFNQAGMARQVPLDTVVDIIKWMQAIKKMSAFL